MFLYSWLRRDIICQFFVCFVIICVIRPLWVGVCLFLVNCVTPADRTSMKEKLHTGILPWEKEHISSRFKTYLLLFLLCLILDTNICQSTNWYNLLLLYICVQPYQEYYFFFPLGLFNNLKVLNTIYFDLWNTAIYEIISSIILPIKYAFNISWSV